MAQTSRFRLIFSILCTIALWGAVILLFMYRQSVYDWWRLRNYVAPSAVVALADQTTMNDSARRLFYVYYPKIEGREAFNEHCGSTEFTIVLGCYSSVKGIFIFKVDDSRLDGIEQVTAAHEFLHAAYARLSKDERKRVDALTASTYDTLDNDRVKETIEEYRKNDPSVVPNELHSILGTEMRNLPVELEDYYKRYFNDRGQIVSFSEAYESEFSSRKNQAKIYEAELGELKSRIDAGNTSLESEQTRLKHDSNEIEAMMRANDSDTASLNARIRSYNAAIDSYNQRVREVSGLVDSYNNTYEVYKQIVLEQQDLFKAIDSRPQQISQ